MPASSEQQLVKYLTDAHSVEQQALTQMRRAPGLAGEKRLADAYREHLAETEEHEALLRGRLEAHGAEPSRAKDLAGIAGGWGMLAFARSQPDSPGKLTAHAFSYENMEVSIYALLSSAAEAAGDAETVAVAARIGAEEKRMAGRLAGLFDVTVDAALGRLGDEELDRHLNHYLQDAHALETQSAQFLGLGGKLVDDDGLAAIFGEHLEQTHDQRGRVGKRLLDRGASRSKLKDLALRVGAFNLAAFFSLQPDTDVKLSGFAYALENLEVGVYELLRRVAERVGDGETAALAAALSTEESAAADRIATTWEPIMRARMSSAEQRSDPGA
jgi:ferritin-like metal-binding protein YciE